MTTWNVESWNKLVMGENCPMCQTLAENADVTPYNYKILEMEAGVLYLQRNQFIKGYCIFIAKQHVIELHQLEAKLRAKFLMEMANIGETLMTVFNADKLNYELLGNGIPHLHAHIKPRYLDDPMPHRRISGQNAGQTILTEEEYLERIRLIYSILD